MFKLLFLVVIDFPESASGHFTQFNNSYLRFSKLEVVIYTFLICLFFNSKLHAQINYVSAFPSDLQKLNSSYNRKAILSSLAYHKQIKDIKFNLHDEQHRFILKPMSSARANNLSIELLSLDVECAENKVFINWETSLQKENDFFTIERSTDGLQFNTIGTVKGAANSSKRLNYQFIDIQPYTGTAHYRLIQTDFNGNRKTYKPIAVECEGVNGEIIVSPNPTSGYFILEGAALNANIEIADITGRIVLSTKCLSPKQPIDLTNKPAGIYYIVVKDAYKSKILKILLTH